MINRILREIYKEFVWGQNEEGERGVALIIAAAFNKPHSIPFLYGTDDDIVYPHSLYGCSGIGQDLAYYFADRLYDPSQTRQQAILLAAFIFREVSQSVAGVGLGTNMMFFAEKNRLIQVIPHNKVKELEENLPDVSEAMIQAFNKGIQIPDWLAADLP